MVTRATSWRVPDRPPKIVKDCPAVLSHRCKILKCAPSLDVQYVILSNWIYNMRRTTCLIRGHRYDIAKDDDIVQRFLILTGQLVSDTSWQNNACTRTIETVVILRCIK